MYSRLFSTANDNASDVEALIASKGDQIRALKEAGTSKADLKPHIDELLSLKARLSPSSPPPPPPDTGLADIRQGRLDKVAAMRATDRQNPYAYTFDATTTASSLAVAFDGKLEAGEDDPSDGVHSVAGRILSRRVFGSLAFSLLQDDTGTLQLQFDKKKLRDSDPSAFKDLKAFTDSGDIIGVTGSIRRTDKSEVRGARDGSETTAEK